MTRLRFASVLVLVGCTGCGPGFSNAVDTDAQASGDAQGDASSEAALPDGAPPMDGAPQSEGGAASDAADGVAPCVTGALSCDGTQPTFCTGGQWAPVGADCSTVLLPQTAIGSICVSGECVSPCAVHPDAIVCDMCSTGACLVKCGDAGPLDGFFCKGGCSDARCDCATDGGPDPSTCPDQLPDCVAAGGAYVCETPDGSLY
jgi:hypothetical protein